VEELDSQLLLWCAERAGNTFAGHSPEELLGVVAMGEQLGEGWDQQQPDLLSQVLK
jgi:hypothetical protein